MNMNIDNIRIVLVETSHPGNIGSSARAMKTMGLRELYLVNPGQFPHKNAYELAAGADDLLEGAKVVATLDEALMGCEVVIGTSARSRTIPMPLLNARECGEKVSEISPTARVAIVFGREYAGLTNEELWKCHYHVHIATDPDYSSLNLAAAVQLIAYEIRMSAGITHAEPTDYDERASHQEVELFFEALEQMLYEIGFISPEYPKRVVPRLRRLFLRAGLEKMEVKILRGILTSIRERRA